MSSPAPAAAPAAPGAPAAPSRDAGPEGFTHRQILVILSGLMLGMFLAALDQNIVATSIRTIADDLQGLDLQAWATTAYLITATISTPLYGKLSDLYGRKPFFLLAIGLFFVGSVLCTISTSMYELAGFRALQGLGAGGLMSLALTIIGDIVPPRQRARYQGYFLAVFGTSSVVGPVVGGFFAGTDSIIGITGWRWVFLVNVPIALVAFVVVLRVLNLPHTRREHRIDAPGAAFLAMTLVPLLIVAEQGRTWGWGSPSALIAYAIGAVGLVLFVLAERNYGDDALLPLRLFRNGVFSLTSLIGLIIGVGMFGGIAILPQYLQIVTGSTPTEAGLQMLPLVGGIMVASVLSGQLISRTGRYKVFPVVGLGLMTAGMFLFHFLLHADTPYWEIALLMALFGLGLGNCMQTLVLAVQNAVPAKDMGVATASSTFFRQMGGTIGVAVFLSVLFSTVVGNIRTAFASAAQTPSFQAAVADPAVRANPANLPALNPASAGSGVIQDSSVLQRMDPRLAQPFLNGFADSMDLVFLFAGIVIAVGFVLIWFLKEIPLRTQSGIQARDAEAQAAGTGEEPPAPTSLEGTAIDAPSTAPPVAAGAAAGPSDGSVRAAASGGGPASAGSSGSGGAVRGPGALDDAPTDPGSIPAVTSASAWGAPSSHAVARPAPARGPAPASSAPAGPGPSGSGLRGRVTAGDVPVADVDVTLHDLTGTVIDRGRSGTDGTFGLHRRDDGTAVLIVSSPRYRPVARLVRPSAGATVELVELQGAGDVAGTVRDTDGQPVAGARVTLTDGRGTVAGVRVTGADGGWSASDLDQGRYTVAVLTADRAPVADTVEVAGPVVHETVVPAVRHAVAGQVRSSTGQPVPEALVVLVGDDGGVRASTVTDDAGRFRVEGLPSGRHMLTASGFAPVSRQVTVDARREPEPVEVVVTPPRPVGPAPTRTSAPGDGAVAPANGHVDRHVRHDHGSGPGNGNGHMHGHGGPNGHGHPDGDGHPHENGNGHPHENGNGHGAHELPAPDPAETAPRH